jgi:hypothetical protein
VLDMGCGEWHLDQSTIDLPDSLVLCGFCDSSCLAVCDDETDLFSKSLAHRVPPSH